MRLIFILIVVFASSFLVVAQQKEDEELKEYFLDAEYFLAQEEYLDALYDYMELYNNGFNTNANINYRIGICYLNILGQKEKSISYLLKSTNNIKNNNREGEFRETKAPMDAYLYLGNAYRVNNMLDKAIEAYNEYKKLLPLSDNTGLNYVNHEIEACNEAKVFMANPVEIRKTNIGEPVNGNSSNFKAVVSGDGQTMLYMNELPFYNAVYYSLLKNGKWGEPVNITPQIQSDGDQYVSSVSYDGKVLYLTKEDNFNSDIYFSVLKDSLWQKSEPLSKKINTKYWESHASISMDGRTLYLTSNRKNGFGGMDIYKSNLDDKGEWQEPENLGSVINTPLNEDTPFITIDGKHLYFSSQGHENMGGYDIFVTTLDNNGNWSNPENLGYPINTTDDDLFYYPWDNGKVAYMSMFDNEGQGKEDIYEIQIVTPELLEEELAEMVARDAEEEEATQRIDTVFEETESPKTVQEVAEEETIGEEVEKQEEKAEEKKPEILKEVNLSPVYFRFDSYELNPEGKTKLDHIASLAREFPNLTFDLIGLTDAIGPASYNKILSEKRAKATKDYLLSRGMNPGKMVAVGYGETRFAAVNTNPDGTDNPEGRKYNRRVEIEIKGSDLDKLKIIHVEVPENLRIK